jgi:betaine-aldehyde dehydrogenase
MSTVATTIDNFIDGARAAPGAGATEEVHDPATGGVIARAPLSDASDVDAAVAAAGRAFESWSSTPPGERALALLRIADALVARGEVLSRVESLSRA